MKIGMILDYTFPPDPRVENEAVSLIVAGHEVFLFCLTYGGEMLNEEINSIKVCRYKSNRLEYKMSALAYTLPVYTHLMSKKIKHFIERYTIEAIHIHDIRIAEAVKKVNKNKKLPTVLDLHDNLPEVMKLYPHLQKFPGKYIISPKKWKQKEEEFINRATKVITVSQEFVEEVLDRTKLPKEKMVLVPNTVRKSFYKDAVVMPELLAKYKNNFVVLYLGDTHVRRGLLTAIRSIRFVKDKIPNLKLVIVGSNTTDTVLKNEVIKEEVKTFVDFEGWQNMSLFPSYIEASSVCISPLRRNKQHDVAYANKVFQYMSFKKPLLVSDATAQKNLVEKVGAGVVHKEQDAQDFAEKLLELYNNQELSDQMGAKGKAFVENEFSWEETSKNLVHLYDKLQD